MRKFLGILLVLVLCAGMMPTALATSPAELPRNETLYVNGLQWGAPASFSPLAGTISWPTGDHNQIFFEALYMYNLLTNENEPNIADGQPIWEDDFNFIVKIKPMVKWNDGEPLTAEDVAYTYNVASKYSVNYAANWTYLEKVEAVDPLTVRFTIKAEPYNRLYVYGGFATVKIIPKHVFEKIEEAAAGDATKVTSENYFDYLVASGPYKPIYWDDTRIVLERQDNYWGQDAAMHGKLAAPKYIAHMIFADNAAGNLAMQEGGNLDVSQQFIPNVWELWSKGQPVSTYIADAPYYLSGSTPSLVFNVTRKGLDDPLLRRAIALSIDYDAIAQDAMCGMTPQLTPNILVLAVPAFNALLNDSPTLDALLWDVLDVDENRADAEKILDEAGYKKGADGFRTFPDGTPMAFKLECPFGWSDWNASLEIVARSAQSIGLNLTTYFPETPIWTTDQQMGTFDMVMASPHGPLNAAQPWSGLRNVLYGASVKPEGEQIFYNYGRYQNPRVDELLELIAGSTDEAAIKAAYTEISEIHLTDLPTVPLMYRPWVFHTVSEAVWTGFPAIDDGTGIPPQIAQYGAGVRSLYNITLK